MGNFTEQSQLKIYEKKKKILINIYCSYEAPIVFHKFKWLRTNLQHLEVRNYFEININTFFTKWKKYSDIDFKINTSIYI